MITYLRADRPDLDNIVGVVALWDEPANCITWFNRDGDYWSHPITEPSPGLNYVTILDFIEFFDYFLCDRAEALTLLQEPIQ